MDSSAASNQSLQETDDYIFLDPRAPRHGNAGFGTSGGGTGGATGRPKRMVFAEGVVLLWAEPGTLSMGTWRNGRQRLERGLHMVERKSWILEVFCIYWRLSGRAVIFHEHVHICLSFGALSDMPCGFLGEIH